MKTYINELLSKNLDGDFIDVRGQDEELGRYVHIFKSFI